MSTSSAALASAPSHDLGASSELELSNGQMRCHGRVLATRVHNTVRYTDLAMPNPDGYRGPVVVEVRSSAESTWCAAHDAVGSDRTCTLQLSSSLDKGKTREGTPFKKRVHYFWLVE